MKFAQSNFVFQEKMVVLKVGRNYSDYSTARNDFEAKIRKFVPFRQRSEALIMGIMWRRCAIKLCPQNVHISYGRSWNVITLYQIGSFYLYGFKVKDLP